MLQHQTQRKQPKKSKLARICLCAYRYMGGVWGGAHTGAVLSMVVIAVNGSKQLLCIHQNLIVMLHRPLPPTLLLTSEMHGLATFNEVTRYPSIATIYGYS